MSKIPLIALAAASVFGLRSAPAEALDAPHEPRGAIHYTGPSSHDFMDFSPDGVREGPLIDLSQPGYATRYLTPSANVQCVSIGVPGNTLDFAVRRPIRLHDRYECVRTSFRVTRCIENCRAAVIQQTITLGRSHPPLVSSFYVSSCRGIIAISDESDMLHGIPFDALLLSGHVGILADPAFPNC